MLASPSPPAASLLPLTAPFSLLVAPVCCCDSSLPATWTALPSLLANPALMLPPHRAAVDTLATTVDACLRLLSQLFPWFVLSPSCRISCGSLSFYLHCHLPLYRFFLSPVALDSFPARLLTFSAYYCCHRTASLPLFCHFGRLIYNSLEVVISPSASISPYYSWPSSFVVVH